MKRFIYAGCSFTHFGYPTWGDIIAYDLITHKGFDQAINLGRGGACNNYIAHQLLMAKSKLDITSKDIVGVCWTTPDRFSYISETLIDNKPASEWQTTGSVYHQGGGIFTHKEHLLTINSAHSCLMRTLDVFNSINLIFDVKYQSAIEHVENMENKDISLYLNEHPIYSKTDYDYMTDSWEKFKRLPLFHFVEQYWNNTLMDRLHSSHPDIISHLNHAQRITDLHNDTVDYFSNLHVKFESDYVKIIKSMGYDQIDDAIKEKINQRAQESGLHDWKELHQSFEKIKTLQSFQWEDNFFDNL